MSYRDTYDFGDTMAAELGFGWDDLNPVKVVKTVADVATAPVRLAVEGAAKVGEMIGGETVGNVIRTAGGVVAGGPLGLTALVQQKGVTEAARMVGGDKAAEIAGALLRQDLAGALTLAQSAPEAFQVALQATGAASGTGSASATVDASAQAEARARDEDLRRRERELETAQRANAQTVRDVVVNAIKENLGPEIAEVKRLQELGNTQRQATMEHERLRARNEFRRRLFALLHRIAARMPYCAEREILINVAMGRGGL